MEEMMKQLKKDLQAVSKSLKQLTRKTEQMAKKLDKLEKPQAAKKPKARAKAVKKKVTKKAVKVTAIGAVLSVIARSKKGVTTAQIKEKTGFDEKKVWNNINFLKRKGKVKSSGRGVYVKV